MTPDHWQRIKQYFHAALDRPAEEREAFVMHCTQDEELRGEVERLLRHHEQTGEFLETTPPKVVLNLPPASTDIEVTAIIAVAPELGEVPGARIGRYKLLQLIGEGGFGSVWLAEQHEPVRRRVALKLIKLGMDTRQVIARFEAERQALAVMDHPHVAKVFDAGATETGRPYFVMEYVQGVPITEHCDRYKLSVRERLVLFIQVCEAVQHAHQKGLIHRDIKPSNILVSFADGQASPKVIDFGVAKAISRPLTDKTLYTEQGQLIGTPAYMSPEQVDLSAQDIDTRSDVYSLGVLLYELLTGSLPFDPTGLRLAGLAEIQRIIREVDPPTPSTRLSALQSEPGAPATGHAESMGILKPVAGAPAAIAQRRRTEMRTLLRALRGDLDWITMKALEKDRTRRYTSASDFAADIRRHLAYEPVLAGPPASAYRLRKFVRRNRGAVLAGSALVAVLVVGVIATTSAMVWALRERERAEQALTAEADQRRLAEESQRRATENEALAIRRAEETKQVADFQSKMLSEIDVPGMGVRLRNDLLTEVAAAMQRAGSEENEIDARRMELEELLAGANLTNVALQQLDRDIFTRALDAVDKFDDQPLVKAQLLHTLGDTLRTLGLFDRATAPQTEALALRGCVLGDEHPHTLDSIGNMGLLLKEQGKLGEAEGYYREALDKQRRVLGDEHPDTLTTINNLGILLKAQGKLADAEGYYREALEGRRRVLGDEHRDTLTSLHNMGSLLQAQGKLGEAEGYHREALAKFRRVLGDEHPSTLTAIRSMGFLLQAQGKIDQAEPYCREALDKMRRILGDEHPNTLTSINNMGFLLQAQGKLDETEGYWREALEKSRRVLGAEHPNTVVLIGNMGSLLKAQGKLDEAEGYCREVLEKRRRTLGDEHPNTLAAINNMGSLLQAQGKLDEAEGYYREALAKQRRVLSDEHPGTLASINNMGGLLWAQGKLTEAEGYFREALEKRRRVQGDEHPDTLALITTMGGLLHAQGKPGEAVALLIPAEPAARRAFTGDNAPRLGRFLAALGRSRASAGAFDEAEANLIEAHANVSQAKGVTNQYRSDVLTGLAELYDAWHTAEPDKGYDAKAAEWRAKLAAWQASTQPASSQPTSPP